MQAPDLDPIDVRILELLQASGRMTNLELAEAIGLSPAQCSRRHRRLEERGVIARYEARLDAAAVGLRVMAYVHIGMERGHMRDLKAFRQALARMPDVLECHSVTGDFDYVLKVIAADLPGLNVFLTERLTALPGVNFVRSNVCLEEVKASSALPLA
ncbi:MAG: Lrp/AsnC family transcriptional regulator [Comamonadaceae bacterium]|nr:MAG: Lrp/AsnC family transcriptional regulator [Comamonadaceae bacterium]